MLPLSAGGGKGTLLVRGSDGNRAAGSRNSSRAGQAAGGQGTLIADDAFTSGLTKWSVELESGGTVAAANGVLDADVPAGATVWLKQQVTDRIVIEYMATAISAGGANDHVTDLNMFWNAHDVRSVAKLFATTRTGLFANYDLLKTHYVGFGSSTNTTARMRRYVGEAGNRPLLFDLTTPLLVANRAYQVKLVADGWLVWLSHHRQPLSARRLHDPAAIVATAGTAARR